jgi:hypothetical protein
MFEALILWGLLMGHMTPLEYKTDSVERIRAIIDKMENVRQKPGEIDRFWMVDQPSTLTPDRTHGGVR